MSNFQKILLFFLLFSGLMFLPNCTNQFSAQLSNIPNSQLNNSNSNITSITSESESIEKKKLDELNKQNEKFRQVPDEWKKIDFQNFKYHYQYFGQFFDKQSKNLLSK
ncbi:MAG: hypothetical protein AAB336_04415, partial [Acidobacteriota bacterium]